MHKNKIDGKAVTGTGLCTNRYRYRYVNLSINQLTAKLSPVRIGTVMNEFPRGFLSGKKCLFGYCLMVSFIFKHTLMTPCQSRLLSMHPILSVQTLSSKK